MDVLDQPGASAPTDPTAVTAASAARPTRSSRRQLALRRELTKLAGQIRPRWRGWIHAGAFPLSIVGGLALVIVSPTIASRIAAALFTLTGMLLFGTSAVYHAGRWRMRIRLLLRRIDHANIFLIIAGTYTPIAVTLLAPRQALTLLLIAWGGALVGVCFRLFWTAAPRWIYVPAYIALGWVAVFYMPALHAGGGWPVVWLLVIGGLAYTAGAVMYALKRPNPSPAWFGFHEIFHAGTLIGFGCHFAAVAVAVL